MKSRKSVTWFLVLLLLSVFWVSYSFQIVLADSTIARVAAYSGGPARGTATGTPCAVTCSATPTEGNVLIAVVSVYGNDVASITQTGVSWSKVVSANIFGNVYVAIWAGIVGAGASTSVSIAGGGSTTTMVANIIEYTGLDTSDLVDKTATEDSGSPDTATDTGTTATTSQADELWIGGVSGFGQSQSTPTNDFALFDGAYFNYVLSSVYLEKIVSGTAAANSGTTMDGSNYYVGAIATFKAASAEPFYPYVQQVSDVDSTADVGTHSDFTAQQYAPDLINDTLTEANAGGEETNVVFSDGFENANFDLWTDGGATTWDDGDGVPSVYADFGSPWTVHGGTYYATMDSNDDGSLISDNINCLGASSIGVSFWYMVDDMDAAPSTDLVVYYYNGATYNLIENIGGATEDTWIHWQAIVTDDQYFVSNFRIRFYGTPGTGEVAFIDDVVINATTTSTNYELQLEEQFTEIPTGYNTRQLCVFAGNWSTAETLNVEGWNVGNSSWTTIGALTKNQWNNVTVNAWITDQNTTFYIRFVDGTQVADNTQSAWSIDVVCMNVYNGTAPVYLALALNITHSFTVTPKWNSTNTAAFSTGESFVVVKQSINHLISTVSTGESYAVLSQSSYRPALNLETAESFTALTESDMNVNVNASTEYSLSVQPQVTFNAVSELTSGFSWSTLPQSFFNVVATWASSFSYSVSLAVSRFVTIVLGWITTLNFSTLIVWNANLTESLSSGFNWAINLLSAFKLTSAFTTAPNWVSLPQSAFHLVTAWTTEFSYNILSNLIAQLTTSFLSGFTWLIQATSTFNLTTIFGSTLTWTTLTQSIFNLISTFNFSATWTLLTASAYQIITTLTNTLQWLINPQAIFNLITGWASTFTWTLWIIGGGARLVQLILSFSGGYTWIIQAASSFHLQTLLLNLPSWNTLPQVTFNLLTSFASGFTLQLKVLLDIVLQFTGSISWVLNVIANILPTHLTKIILTWVTGYVYQLHFPLDISFEEGLVVGGVIAAIFLFAIGFALFVTLRKRDDD